jgi:hypothetical protein
MVKSVLPVHLKEYLNICEQRFNTVEYLFNARTVKPAETAFAE